MPPRHTKSEFASYLFPAWFLGRYPEKKIIQTAHTAELAVGFGRKVRNLINQEDFQSVFPGISLYQTPKRLVDGIQTSAGTTLRLVSAVPLLVRVLTFSLLMTPIRNKRRHWGLTTQKSMTKSTNGTHQARDSALQPGGAIIIVMTRWSVRDLTGKLSSLPLKERGADEWEVIELPAIMPSGDPLWPEFWPIDQLEALKAELPISKWSAQYQQDPTSEEGR